MFNSGASPRDQVARDAASQFRGSTHQLLQTTIAANETKRVPVGSSVVIGAFSDGAFVTSTYGGIIRVVSIGNAIVRIQARLRFGATSSYRSMWLRHERSAGGGTYTTVADYLALVETNSAYAPLALNSEPLAFQAGDALSLFVFNQTGSVTTIADDKCRLGLEVLEFPL